MLGLAINAVLLVLGVLFGWWLRSSPARIAAQVKSERCDASADVERAKEVLNRLHDLAANVAADVGAHNSRVEAISDELNAVEEGQSEAVLAAVAKLVEANSQMQQRLASAEEKLQEQKQVIASHAAEARTDALTGVPNRRAFDDMLAKRMAEFVKDQRPASVAMLDVDHFKKFNDTYGHQAGDEVLRGVAQALRRSTRQGDFVARYGGEEFAIILQNAAAADAAMYVDRMRAAVEATRFHFNGQEVQVAASMGVAQLAAGETGPSWVERADTALYASKAGGRNCVHWHDGQQPQRYAPKSAAVPAAAPAVEKPAADRPTTYVAPSVADAQGESESIVDNVSPSMRLLNRTAFCTNLSNRLAEQRRGGAAPAIVMCRLDRFKAMEAEYGRQVAAAILRATTKFLLAAVREMDSVADYGGADFAMLFPATTLIDTAAATERLRHTIEQSTLNVGGRTVRFTLSFGVSQAGEGDDLKRVLQRASQALETASWPNGNSTCCHTGQAVEHAQATLERLKALAQR